MRFGTGLTRGGRRRLARAYGSQHRVPRAHYKILVRRSPTPVKANRSSPGRGTCAMMILSLAALSGGQAEESLRNQSSTW
jgi:hypothetical protein